MQSRRRFLAWLAGSPLLSGQEAADVITAPVDAINVLEFEPAARKALPPAHFGYMATGVDDDATLQANREGFSRLHLRPRRLVDVTRVDLRTEIFGSVWETPIALAPVGNMKAFHPNAEVEVAKAARAKRTTQILSTVTTTPISDVCAALGRPVWYQLYTSSRWDVTEKLVRRAEEAGCPVLALTVDTQAGRRIDTFERSKRLDKRECAACHGTTREDFYRRKPMFEGIDVKDLKGVNEAMTWADLRRLKRMSSMKLVIKGIETGEDAKLCIENGADGVIVSNHGGRATETGRGTIDCLPEIVEAIGGRAPVLIDGGFRRGTDIFKAIALGASAVCIGRPYLWGLGAFGQAGVERVVDLLRSEFQLVMKQCGATSIAQIGRSYVGYNDWRR